MQIQLQFQATHIDLTLPAMDDDSDLAQALSYGVSDSRAFDDIWDLPENEPATVALPFYGWRNVLRALSRSYTFASTRRKPEGYKAEPLTYVVDGVSYDCERDIPTRADMFEELGEFALTAPTLLAIDPCYEDLADAVAMPALTGKWVAAVTMRDTNNGYGVARLAVRHESVDASLAAMFDPAQFEQEPAGAASVDSAQCGFFDAARYPQSKSEHEHRKGSFYYGCCAVADCDGEMYGQAEKPIPGGVTPDSVGVNSRTLLGDGSHRVMVRRDAQGAVIAAILLFDYKDEAFPYGDY